MQASRIETPPSARPSPATSSVQPSSTETLGHSSPDLPPLPPLPSGLPVTPHAEDAHFFTASWGSPYRQPSPRLHSRSRRHNRDTWALGFEPDGYDDGDGDGPDSDPDPDSPRFGLDHLIPNRLDENGEPKLRFNLEHLLPKRLPSFFTRDSHSSSPLKGPLLRSDPAREKTSAPRELADGWIKQFLQASQWQSDKSNWWTDGSTDEGSDETQPPEASQQGKGHRPKQDNRTLRQADFWTHFGQKGRETVEKMLASRFTDALPPMDRHHVSQPEPSASLEADVLFDVESRGRQGHRHADERLVDVLPHGPVPNDVVMPSEESDPAVVPAALVPAASVNRSGHPLKRSKKRVLWRNRNIIIQIPHDPWQGKDGGPPQPLTQADLDQRLHQFEEANLDIHGFDAIDENGVVSRDFSQNRVVWPDPAAEEGCQTRVSIPDRAEWDRYVAFLTEQKLAALGVTLAPDDAMVESLTSRSASAHQFPGGPALAFSPPPQPISVGSQPFSPFSLPSGPSPIIPGHVSRTSIASPISTFANQRPAAHHFQRHSTFTSSPTFSQQQPTPPGLLSFSPSLFLPHTVGLASSSPTVHTSGSPHGILSPVSPSNGDAHLPAQYPFPQSTDAFPQINHQPPFLLQKQLSTNNNNRLHIALDKLPEEDDGEESPRPQTPVQTIDGPSPNILVPTPRGSHRPNISQNLEREIRDAEYHLEEAIDRQLDEDGEFGSVNRFAIRSPPHEPTRTNNDSEKWKDAGFVQQQQANGQHPFRGPTYRGLRLEDDERTNVSDVETNPSIEGQNDRSTGVSSHATFASSNLNSSHHVSHSSQGSVTSKLNVQAPEFKFPSAQHFAALGSPPSSFDPVSHHQEQWEQQQSTGQYPHPVRPSTRLHAAVPSFVPSFKLSGLGLAQSPLADLAAEGPAVQFGSSPDQSGIATHPDRSLQHATGPFDIDTSVQDTSRPSKRSKAIPIIPPGLLQIEDDVSPTFQDSIRRVSDTRDSGTPTPNGIRRQPTPFKLRAKTNANLWGDSNRHHSDKTDLGTQSLDLTHGTHATSPWDTVHHAEAASVGRLFPALTGDGKDAAEGQYEERPTFNEIDEIMRAMNDQGSEFGIIREQQALRAPPPGDEGALPSYQSAFGNPKPGLATRSVVNKLGGDLGLVSDWDDLVTPEEACKLKARPSFFDYRVDGLIDNVLQSRLGPLERSIHNIKHSISAMAMMNVGRSRRSASGEPGESDADDEDDDLASQHRNRSPGKNRKLERIKSAVVEALAQAPNPAPPPGIDIAEFYQALADLKMSIARSAANDQLEDFRVVINDALDRQSSALSQKQQQEADAEAVTRILQLERAVVELEQQNEVALESRRIAERSEDNAQRELVLVREELALARAECEDATNTSRALGEKVHTLQTENEALQSKEDGLRLSGKRWCDEINKANNDNEKLCRSISTLEAQNQEFIRVRDRMRCKLEQLEKDLVATTAQVADENDRRSRQELEHAKKHEALRIRMEAEARTRERFEREMERLEEQEREGMRVKVILDQTQRQTAVIEGTMGKLREENADLRKRAEDLEREAHNSREAARTEIQRARVLMSADLDAARKAVGIAHDERETENRRLHGEIEQLRVNYNETKTKHEALLQDEADARLDALREAHDDKDRALKEQQHLHEQALEDHRQQLEKLNADQQQRHEKHIEELHRQHNRDLANAIEDGKRREHALNDRLSLADEKVEFLQDKVIHLEEKLEVATSAAQAAAAAAAVTVRSAHTPAAAAAVSADSALPSAAEKVSPQALRESIAVLQEQLQEREERIESLNQRLSEFDDDAPQKLKERETEIGWLRELLGVRVDDITDLINALAQPTFDREQVRDAAIRIRTNLQMEQHEKERLISGGQSFPALASLSSFASPKAAQLAAIIGNWRKGGSENARSEKLLRSPTNDEKFERTPPHVRDAPAGFLAGLMTPPPSQPRRKTGLTRINQTCDGELLSSARGAMGLLTKSAYDRDAPASTFSPGEFSYDEDADGDTTYTDAPSRDKAHVVSLAVEPGCLDPDVLAGAMPPPKFEPFGPASEFDQNQVR